MHNLVFQSDPDCEFCQKVPPIDERTGEYFCLDCGVLHQPVQKKITGVYKCYECNGKGKTKTEKMRQVCCENYLEIGLCCQFYKMDIQEISFDCSKCNGTGYLKFKPKT